ncbi:MAG TPA: hypothetical protein VH092_31030 [Urbifossiella sp.]|nr:hypothetical protein [Urbifossiella sp.]
MTRSVRPAGVLMTLLFAIPGPSAAQHVIGPGRVGSQPQVNTSPYQTFMATPSAPGGYPVVGPVQGPPFPYGMPYAPRFATRPTVIAPAVRPNNPLVFNRGFAAPFPLPVPPPGMVGLVAGNGAAFNPVLVARPGVVSSYYFPPIAAPPGESEGRTPPWTGPVLYPVTGTGPGLSDTPPGTLANAKPEPGSLPSSGARETFPGSEFHFIPWVW